MNNIKEIFLKDYRKLTISFLLLQIVFFTAIFLAPTPLYPLIGFVFFFSIFLILPKPEYILLVLIFYISILPNKDWGSAYQFFNYYVDMRIVLLMLFCAGCILYLRSLKEEITGIKFGALDKLFFIFIIYILINGVWGMSQGNGISNVYVDVVFAGLYASYFIFRIVLNNQRAIRTFIIILIIGSTLASIQYIVFSLSNLQSGSIFLTRVTTQQPHLAQISIPLLTGIFLFRGKLKYKIISFALILPNFAMVIFSQQRSLYVSVVISIFIVIFFYIFREGVEFRKLIKFIFGIISFVLVIILFIVLLEYYFHINFIFTIFQRMGTLQDVTSDTSWTIRFTEVKFALEKWSNHPIIGSGMGSTYPNIFFHRGNTGVDNSYAFVLWKMGIMGLILFMFVYLKFLWIGIVDFWKKKSYYDKMIIAGFLAGMLGMMLIAITNESIILYRFNIIWAAIIAITYNLALSKE